MLHITRYILLRNTVEKMKSHKDLDAWKKSMDMVDTSKDIYEYKTFKE